MGRHSWHPGRPVQVNPIKATLETPGTKRLTLKYDEPLSTFALTFNLRHYTQGFGVVGWGATQQFRDLPLIQVGPAPAPSPAPAPAHANAHGLGATQTQQLRGLPPPQAAAPAEKQQQQLSVPVHVQQQEWGATQQFRELAPPQAGAYTRFPFGST
jgi:hypothetical protein